MKEDVGVKIQCVAEIIRAFGMLASIFIGVICCSSNLIFGLIIIAVGCFSVWVSFLCLYGFGELILETTAHRENSDRILDILESRYGAEYETELQSASEE